jgi:HPt (histidine-containing phosphotransfer) domain-containing protein
MTDLNEDELFMEELRQEFEQTISSNLIELQELMKIQSFDQIARIAHDIKGTSGVFGFEEGSDIAKDLQHAAEKKEEEKIKQLIDQLTAYMKENVISK